MIGEKNATYLYVGNVTNGYADAASVDFNTMPKESVVIVKAEQDSSGGSEAEEGALASGQKYFVVAKTKNGEIRKSPMFESSDIVREGIQDYSQPVQQVSFLGYDGSTVNGLGDFTEADEYIIRLNLRHTQNTLNNTPEIKPLVHYATDTTTATAAKSFMESFLRNFSPTREPYPTILCDRIAKVDGNITALGGSGTIALVTKGSKTVKAYVKDVAADTAVTADDFSVTAGDVISIPSYNGRTFTFDCLDAVSHAAYIGTESYVIADAATAADGSDNATALAAAINASSTICTAAAATATVTITLNEEATALPPMVFSDVDSTPARVAVTIATGDDVAVKYKAATTTAAATFELDEPWQGPTGYIHDHTVEATSIGEATLDGDNWGLKFTGLYNNNFNPVTDTPTIVEFDVLAGDLDSITEYKDVYPNRGSGSWREVAALENYAQGMDRFYMADDMISRREFNAAEGYNYDIISLSLSQSPYTSSATGQKLENPFTINIALADSIADYDEIDAVFGLD